MLLTMVLLSNGLLASTQTGTVTSILVRDDGLHWFYITGARTEKPDCSINKTYWMIKDEETVYGKSQFSMLLSAYVSGKKVKVFGSGHCTRWGDGEDVSTIQFTN